MWFSASKATLEPERRSSTCQVDCSHSSSTGSSEQLQAQRQPAGGSLQQEINPGHSEEPRSFQLELNWLGGGQTGIQMLTLYENGTLSKALQTCISFFFIEPWKWNLKQQYTWGNTCWLPTMGLGCDGWCTGGSCGEENSIGRWIFTWNFNISIHGCVHSINLFVLIWKTVCSSIHTHYLDNLMKDEPFKYKTGLIEKIWLLYKPYYILTWFQKAFCIIF